MKHEISTKEKIDYLHKLKKKHPEYTKTIDGILKMYNRKKKKKRRTK